MMMMVRRLVLMMIIMVVNVENENLSTKLLRKGQNVVYSEWMFSSVIMVENHFIF